MVQIDPKLLPRWLNLEPSWIQVGSKLAQVDAKLAPNPLRPALSWLQIRSGRPQKPLSEDPGELLVSRGSPQALGETPGGAKMASDNEKSTKNDQKFDEKRTKIDNKYVEVSGCRPLCTTVENARCVHSVVLGYSILYQE